MKNLVKIKTLVGIFALTVVLASCNKDEEPVAMETPTVYDQLGGTTMVSDPSNPGKMIEKGRLGIRGVVDSTILVIAGDTKLQPFFATLLQEVTSGNTTNFALLSNDLTDFFCIGTGAKNFTYTGLNMKNAHDPAINPRMAIKSSNADMDQFINDVVVGAKKNGVPDNLIGEVGKVLESLRADVVQK